MARCHDEKRENYYLYGGRGIKVCERWNKFSLFLDDMGMRPVGTVLDRRDNLIGYCKENCWWASYKASTENRKNTVWIKYKGREMRVSDFADFAGIPSMRVYSRMASGWTAEEIFETKRKMNGFYRDGTPLNPRHPQYG